MNLVSISWLRALRNQYERDEMFSGHAWRVVKFGEPKDAVELHELTWGEPSPGQVLIRVRTAGAGFPDAMMTAGHFPLLGEPPFGLGEEAAGEVVAVPPGSRFAIGDQVAGITGFLEGWGGYAEYAYVREGSAIRIPAGMTDEQAGGFPIGFRTAYAGLVERAPVEAGQTLLILGAAGSSGVAALQLGKALGTTVIAVAGSQEKLEFCARYGADHVVNYRTDDLTARITEITEGCGVDLIYDPIGGDTAATAVKSIARNGRIAVIGLASGSALSLDSMDMLLRNYTAVGVLASPNDDPETEAAVWDHLVSLAKHGAITTPVGRVYGFDEVPRMVAEQTAPGAGKSVVRVASK
ncbi:NADPH:quinone oxidoreductase family protein [Streptomyces lunaelactis]|uniref:NADPH:quinone oxidoreductase family protein n=1 Tax=Streptomyces lunaelactis TaxID=1535768 RepID=UPI0015846BC3|nr:NADPH:quinone oxidoreductase family protein [Streptomyces lunaelactis]NUL06008.1 NADPH:quinone oxidoreductase family protein [Streptomyces lunaelactis]